MMLHLALVAIATSHATPPTPIVGPKTVRIVAGNDYLRAPEQIGAGPVRIHFVSEGQATYQLHIAKLPDGVAIENIDRLVADGKQIAWVRFRPAGGSPLRRSGDVVTRLDPGHYLLVALTTGSNGQPIRRLVRPLVVT